MTVIGTDNRGLRNMEHRVSHGNLYELFVENVAQLLANTNLRFLILDDRSSIMWSSGALTSLYDSTFDELVFLSLAELKL